MTTYDPNIAIADIVQRRLHHTNGRFVNPLAREPRHSFFQVLKWRLFSKNGFKAHYAGESHVPVIIDWQPVLNAGNVSVTYINHASVFIKAGNTKILIDPIFFGLPGFFKDYTPLVLSGRPVPDPDVILLTHGHYDHLDKKTLSVFGSRQKVVSPLGYHDVLSDLGIQQHVRLDWLDSHFIEDVKITLVPANHWTMRNPLKGPNTSLWGGYVIETAQGPTIFISGDTAYFPQFCDIGNRFDIDLAIFNLGAYEPRWFMAQSHLNPVETVQAFQDLKAKALMAVHWGTFRLGDEPVHFPPKDLKTVMTEKGLADHLLSVTHGRTVEISAGLAPMFSVF